MTVQVEVVQGQVQLSCINYVVDTPTFKVIHVETSSKRFDVYGGTLTESDGTTVEQLMLMPVEGSMHLDETTDEQTRINLDLDKDSTWQLSYDTYGRYGFDIIMYQVPDSTDKETDIIWQSND